jgi:hypothetical protein
MNRWLLAAGVTLLLAVLAYFYLLPASLLALRGDTSLILTDGGDAVTAPTVYWTMVEAVTREPARLLFGTVYTELLHPPEGYGLWMAWQDRVLVTILGSVVPVEVVPTALVWALMVLNGLSFYAFGRVEGWRRPVCLALGIAFAFSVYTRARAFVHPSLVGLYVLPLAFLALRLTQRARRPRELVLPALALLGCATSSHYYILMVAAVSPLLLWFYLRDLPRGTRLAGTARLAAVAAPAILFLGWNLLATAPPQLAGKQAVFRPPVMTHWLTEFAARPSDYLVGDIAEKKDRQPDWNPLRARVSAYAQKNVHPSNFHERSNGIRWVVLAGFAALAAAMVAPRARRRLPEALRHPVAFYLVFTLCAFLLSLAPGSLHLETDLGPSRLVHAIFPNFRVPCRYGAFVHFGVLAAVGWGLHALLARVWERPSARWAAAILLPAVAVADYPPMVGLPMLPPAPTLAALEAASPGGVCGTGLVFPYTASHPHFEHEKDLYAALQRIRGTRCRLLNAPAVTETSQRLMATLGHNAFAAAGRAVEDKLIAFARCARLEWIAFEPSVPPPTRNRVCAALAWPQISGDVCRARAPAGETAPLLGCLPP